jgi:hypothetical protein
LTWQVHKNPGPNAQDGGGGSRGMTPLDMLLSRRMAPHRTAEIVREAARLMDGGGHGGAGASLISPTATADWKTRAAVHFFNLPVNGVGIDTKLPAPIVRIPGREATCVGVRTEVSGKTKGDFLRDCEKGSVFMEAKNAIAKVLVSTERKQLAATHRNMKVLQS